MNIVDAIRAKRDGHRLSDDQIRFVIAGVTDESIPDYQISALLMAILWRGMEPAELATWTAAMIASGERLDLSGVGRPTVDKHSTGGVGDKVSLVLCPLVAACGAAVPQLSGRGLGHTGGTLDKMEAIPGWRATLTNEQFIAQLRDVGVTIAAAGAGLAPADRKLYAMRDVTGTVESIPLIASSIMSKKIAEGTGALVLDVKFGAGAFMQDFGRAKELATTMVGIGEGNGVRTRALLTDMDAPLGVACGNGMEVTESVEMLAGGGPRDLVELTLALAREMLDSVGLTQEDPAAALSDGRAMDVWRRMVAAQGGDPDAELRTARVVHAVTAERAGVIQRLDALAVGQAVWRLGAGRAKQGDPVSPSAGAMVRAKPGDRVGTGQTILELHVDDETLLPGALEALAGGILIGDEPPVPRPLIAERIVP